jgi:hypothetical protein
MPRLLVHLTEDQRRRLRRAAEAEDTSMAEVVRRAVELYLRLTPDRFERALRAAGRFAGDAPDVSVEHDRYLEDAYRT